MTRYIFHGGGRTDDGGKSFYEALLRDVPDNGNVLVCYFASRNTSEEDQENSMSVSQLIEQIAPPKNVSVTMATEDDFVAQINAADAVTLRDGSTERLITTLQNYFDLKKAFIGKTISGSSAGAYALSTWYSDHYSDRAVPGLGIVPVRVITHFEGETIRPSAGAVAALEDISPELPLIKLREGEWEEFVVK